MRRGVALVAPALAADYGYSGEGQTTVVTRRTIVER